MATALAFRGGGTSRRRKEVPMKILMAYDATAEGQALLQAPGAGLAPARRDASVGGDADSQRPVSRRRLCARRTCWTRRKIVPRRCWSRDWRSLASRGFKAARPPRFGEPVEEICDVARKDFTQRSDRGAPSKAHVVCRTVVEGLGRIVPARARSVQPARSPSRRGAEPLRAGSELLRRWLTLAADVVAVAPARWRTVRRARSACRRGAWSCDRLALWQPSA